MPDRDNRSLRDGADLRAAGVQVLSEEVIQDARGFDRSTEQVNAMTVDVEEYFQVWAFADVTEKSRWSAYPSRIAWSMERILRLFDEANVKATFFTLGWIGERFPEIVRQIASRGHEVASHGYDHEKVTNQSPAEFSEDVSRAKSILEDITGKPVVGYRAPSFSINQDNMWALDVLGETGHSYSSSIYPISHDHYGMPDASRFAFCRSASFLEIPMSTTRLFGKNLPCGGGGYFRLLPYRYFKWSINRLNKVEQEPAVFYFHPWEVDPDQPRIQGAALKSKFRHYTNLRRMEERLTRLLSDFRWDRMDTVFLDR